MKNNLLHRLSAGVVFLFASSQVWASDLASLFTLQAPQGQWVVRAITHAAQCPGIAWDGQKPVPMQMRAPQATVPVRSDAAQSDSKPSVFEVSTCEAAWPAQATSAQVEGQRVPRSRKAWSRVFLSELLRASMEPFSLD